MLDQEIMDLSPIEDLTDSEVQAGDDAGGAGEDEPLTDSEVDAEDDAGEAPRLSGRGKILTKAQIAYLNQMRIHGCGLGRRIHMLMGTDDWTTPERVQTIRENYPEPGPPPVVVALEDEEPWEPPDPTVPETCEATREPVPDLPPQFPSDIPDETEESKIIAVATEIGDITKQLKDPTLPPVPAKVTAALKRAASAIAKPPKPGSDKYWALLSEAIAGIRDYLARTGGTQEREGWAQLLLRIEAQLDAARRDPYAGLPVLPFFWPGLPPGVRAVQITPIYQAPPGSSIALPPGSYTGTKTPPTPDKNTTKVTINVPPAGLSEEAGRQWLALFGAPQPTGA